MRKSIGFAAALALAGCGGGGESGNNAAGGTEGGGKAAEVAMQPGEWEMTTTMLRMSVPGAPANMPTPAPQSARRCITPEEAASPTRGLVNDASNENCTVQNNSGGGGRIQISLQCQTPQGNMQATISGQHTATTVEINQQIRTQAQGASVEMDARTTGRRIGDCPAGQQTGGQTGNTQ